MDALKLRGDVTTYNVGPAAAPPVPAELRAGLRADRPAWSSGIKTLDGRLGQGPSSGVTVPGTNFKTYMEIARDRGLSTGNVSTAEITDATPAGPSSHISQRGCQGPNDTRTACPTETKAAGGLGSIAEQQADEKFDVVLGGGRARYAQPLEAGGTQERHRLRGPGQGLQVRRHRGRDERRHVARPRPAPARPVPRRQHDDRVQPADRVRHGRRLGTTKCTPSNRGTEPTLNEMTDKAIKLLQGNPKGFVLQVEGASIDKRDHASDACGQIGELLGMDDAIGVAQEFQRTHPDTLILVTADHSHTSQIIPVRQVPRGAYTTLQTVDGQPIRIAYGTAPVAGSQAHTGSTVPVFASGPRAADIVGTIDQTELFPVLTNTRTGDGRRDADRRSAATSAARVPATLALTSARPAAVRARSRPGVARDYTAALAANVISTGGATRPSSIADPSATATGHLVNGTFSLPQPLQAKAKDRRVRPGRRQRRADDAADLDRPGVQRRRADRLQAVDRRRRALRTGAYGKTLTLTLSTTAP